MQTGRMAAVSMVCLLAVIPPAVAIDSAALVQGLRSAQIWKPGTPISVDRAGDAEVTVTTLKNPKATTNDLKIDAVLVAKQLMYADPQDIKRVKVNFFHSQDYYDSTCDHITVREGDVKAYAAKAIAEKDLLESLTIATSGSTDNVCGLSLKTPEGLRIDALGELISLAGRLRKMEGQGADVSSFEPVINELFGKLNKQDSLTAEQEMSQVGHRLKELEYDAMQPPQGTAAPVVRPAVRFEWRPLFRNMYFQLQEILGNQAPVAGVFAGQRTRIIAKIHELEGQGANVDESLKAYLNMEETVRSKPMLARQALNQIAEQLTLPAAPKTEPKSLNKPEGTTPPAGATSTEIQNKSQDQ